MMDQPSALELVTAVREFIEKRAMPELQGHTAFHARVAANALAIVARELEQGAKSAAEEETRLKALRLTGTLEEMNRALCRRIREGDHRARRPGAGGAPVPHDGGQGRDRPAELFRLRPLPRDRDRSATRAHPGSAGVPPALSSLHTPTARATF